MIAFHCSPEGKKFRSRNELAKYFQQIRSPLNSQDFDFSVKGNGHHNKGKTPIKKGGGEASEGSKENQQQSAKGKAKAATPASGKRKTPSRAGNSSSAASTPATSDRPKRQLRKRLRSDDPENDLATIAAAVAAPPPPVAIEDEEKTEDDDDPNEVSNVKLKVKVGYTATGAMIRPSANGGRKKKRRFRNMSVKKSPPASTSTNNTKASAKSPTSSPAKKTNPVVSTPAAAADPLTIKEEATQKPAPKSRKFGGRKKRKVKGKATEPVAGPSGLQKIKRSPRRVLKRKTGAHQSEDDDEDDVDYFSSLYPKPEAAAAESSGLVENDDPLKINDEDVTKSTNGEANGVKEISPAVRTTRSNLRQRTPVGGSATTAVIPRLSPRTVNGGAVDPLSTSLDSEVGPMVAMDQSTESIQLQLEEVDPDSGLAVDNMQVVVIGDSVEDLHNYAKPHAE